MEKIIEQISGWEYLSQLPAEYAGFALDAGQSQSGSQYLIFAYKKPKDYRSFEVLYDKATKDYLARITVGLTEYYDVNYICGDLASLERTLALRMAPTLAQLADPAGQGYESIFHDKQIAQWPYAAELPPTSHGFTRFIDPRTAVKTINGSYIVIDYSDFAAASNLIVYYNVYRDEFFGEVRLRYTPRMINLFDARELVDLAGKLKDNLGTALEGLRGEISQGGESLK
ncbi:MAG: hypothetical protein P4N41_09560 [Negativicutes bacterium]|nr:hypothetical protein [Negativicutes bacterium]MDR3589891.1 hypothetical protein [Negativicutes bacterium]